MILFPAHPLSPRTVDDHFAAQAEAATNRALIDHDALLRGDAAGAVRRVPRDAGPCWYRGWMIPSARYSEFAAALAERGAQLCTTAPQYRRAHELPGWYETFREVTPRTVFSVADAAELGGGPGIVKDFVKSRKHEWHTACYVSDLDDAAELNRVVAAFVEGQGEDLAGGVVVRRFEQFSTGEARVWWLDGAPVLVGPHPDTPQITPEPDLSHVAPLVSALDCRFVTTDLARHTDGRWRVVEVGDGQVSDWPSTVPAALLIAALEAAA